MCIRDSKGGDSNLSLFSKTNFADADSAPLTNPQVILLTLNKVKNSFSTNNSSFLIKPDQSLLSLVGFPPK